jgi:hypothetical protein
VLVHRESVTKHPYRSRATTPVARKKIDATTVVLTLVWIACVAWMLVVVCDHTCARSPFTGLAFVLAVGIPCFVANARLIADD